MPYFREIVTRVNNRIKDTLGVFSGGVYDGIAYKVTTEGRELPAVDNKGELKYTGIDDNYPFVLYHRILSNTYEIDKQFEFWTNSTTRMTLVVYAKRSIVKLAPYEFAEAIGGNIPRTVSTTGLDGMSNILLEVNSINLNPKEVFNQEYNGVEFQLAADEIFFSIQYTIKTTFRKDCITDCCEGTISGDACTLCGQIEGKGGAAIHACLSDAQVDELEAIICNNSCTYDVYINSVFSQQVTLTNCEDLTINLV